LYSCMMLLSAYKLTTADSYTLLFSIACSSTPSYDVHLCACHTVDCLYAIATRSAILEGKTCCMHILHNVHIYVHMYMHVQPWLCSHSYTVACMSHSHGRCVYSVLAQAATVLTLVLQSLFSYYYCTALHYHLLITGV
jgi:hypothetical protein